MALVLITLTLELEKLLTVKLAKQEQLAQIKVLSSLHLLVALPVIFALDLLRLLVILDSTAHQALLLCSSVLMEPILAVQLKLLALNAQLESTVLLTILHLLELLLELLVLKVITALLEQANIPSLLAL